MKERITIKVLRESGDSQKPFITLYEMVVDSDTSIFVPYQTLVDAFRFVYGKGVIVDVRSDLI